MSINESDLDVLACDYARRPKESPSFFDLEDAIQSVRRTPTGETLLVTFAPETTSAVALLIEAERLCCPDIRWEFVETPAPQVHITAQPGQLAVFENFLPQRA